jgi:hypothetical protein
MQGLPWRLGREPASALPYDRYDGAQVEARGSAQERSQAAAAAAAAERDALRVRLADALRAAEADAARREARGPRPRALAAARRAVCGGLSLREPAKPGTVPAT